MMCDLKQIRICGFGGQGVVLAGTILGQAAINAGKWVAGSNSYGAQARGGSARSDVVISSDPIKYPHVLQADILIALSQSAYDEYIGNVREEMGSIVIYEDTMVNPRDFEGVKLIGIAATNTAIHKLDSKQVANIVILGASVALTGIASKQSLVSSIKEHVQERFKQLNLKALEVGYKLGEDKKK